MAGIDLAGFFWGLFSGSLVQQPDISTGDHGRMGIIGTTVPGRG